MEQLSLRQCIALLAARLLSHRSVEASELVAGSRPPGGTGPTQLKGIGPIMDKAMAGLPLSAVELAGLVTQSQ